MRSTSKQGKLFICLTIIAITFLAYNFDLLAIVQKDRESDGAIITDTNKTAYHQAALPSVTKNALEGGKNLLDDKNENIIHFVQQGTRRCGTTFQFQVVCLSLFLQIKEQRSELLDEMTCHLVPMQNFNTFEKDFKPGAPTVIKTHYEAFYEHIPKNSTGIFLAHENKNYVHTFAKNLTDEGYNVMYKQDLETLVEKGVDLIREYAALFNLTQTDEENLLERFRLWDILRMCCGKQMSKKWRNELYPPSKHNPNMPKHPSCSSYDIDKIEQEFLETEITKELEKYPKLQKLNQPALMDGKLFGRYCSSYNDLVRTEGVGINEGIVNEPVEIEKDD